tara:strand:- start:703 stop:858 length:156 start_codon:yes stop_codon:yes gene_type:complete
MTVYVVIEYEKYEGNRVVAVFDSEEKAQDYIYNNERGDPIFSLDLESYTVQ